MPCMCHCNIVSCSKQQCESICIGCKHDSSFLQPIAVRIVESVFKRMQPGLFLKRQKLPPYGVYQQNCVYTTYGVTVVVHRIWCRQGWDIVCVAYYQNHVKCHRWSRCGWDTTFGVYMDETPYIVHTKWCFPNGTYKQQSRIWVRC